MARHKVFDSPVLGYEVYEHDPVDGGLIVIESVSRDTELVMDTASDMRIMKEGKPMGDGMELVGVMPLDIYGAMCRDGSINDEQKVLEWLNNRDFSKLRTSRGRA